MRLGSGGSGDPAPGPPDAFPSQHATPAKPPGPTAPGPRPGPPPAAVSPAPPAPAPTHAPPTPAMLPSGRCNAARDTGGTQTTAPDRCPSVAGRPRHSRGTALASSSGSPSGSVPTLRSSRRPARHAGASPPADPDSSPSPPHRSVRPRSPGSPRRGTPSHRPPRPASTTPLSPSGPPRATTATASTRAGAPFFLDPVEARHHRLQPPFEDQPRSRQRRPAVVGQGATHRGAVTLNRLGLRVVTALDLALDRPHPADALLQFLLGVAVGLEDRLGCLAEVVHRPNAIGALRTTIVIPFRSSTRRFIPHLANRSWPDAE